MAEMEPLQVWEAEIEFLEPVLGTSPSDRSTWETFIRPLARQQYKQAEEAQVRQEYLDLATLRELAKATEVRDADADEADAPPPERPLTVFFRDHGGLFLWDYQILGHLKEMANMLKTELGIKNARAKLEQSVWVRPRRCHFTGTVERAVVQRPLRAQTMQGPRVTIATSEAVLPGAHLVFRVAVLPHSEIKPGVVQKLLTFGEWRGMGQWRTGGWGRYRLVRWEAGGSA